MAAAHKLPRNLLSYLAVGKWYQAGFSYARHKVRNTGYKYYGLNRGEHEGKAGIWYREWAPGARVRAQPSSEALHWGPERVGTGPL